MFVGQTGVGRIVQRTAELVRQGKDPRAEGAIPFDMLQRYLNFWYAVSLDLFGSEVSTNGANYFGGGLEGPAEGRALRGPRASRRLGASVELFEDGRIVEREVAPRMAVNLEVRNAYVEDCRGGARQVEPARRGPRLRFRLPSQRFHRGVGTFAAAVLRSRRQSRSREAEFRRREHELLPSEADREYVRSLMTKPVIEPGKFANWIAPPARGINSQPPEFEYVRLD